MDATHLSHFCNILGDKGVLTPVDNLGAYETGGRGDHGKAALVLRPESTEQVSAVVSYCVREGLHFIPQSGNTGLVGASVPDETGTQIVLSLERIKTVHGIDTVNKSAHVDAGVRLWGFNDSLEDLGLELPIDLGADPCIGGMVATNTGGSRFLKYRGMREHVLGVKAVLADEDGTVIDALCPLHKNNTGFDVKQLFIGSGGVFGVVTEVIVRLSPLARQSATALLVPASTCLVNDILIAVEQASGEYLSAFEGMSGESIKRALDHVPSLSSPFGQSNIPEYVILLELSRSWPERESEQPMNEVLENVLSEIWEDYLDDALIGPPEKLWALRHALSEGVQKSGHLYAFDLSFKRGDVMGFCDNMRIELEEHYPALTLCDFGHIGDGAVHFNLIAPEPVDEKALRSWVIEHADLADGSYSAEHGLGRKNQAFYDRYTPEEVKAVTCAIKAAIAPGAVGVIKV